MTTRDVGAAAPSARSILLPLALAQFIASYAATNMNVAVTNIADDLGTNVVGVQTASSTSRPTTIGIAACTEAAP